MIPSPEATGKRMKLAQYHTSYRNARGELTRRGISSAKATHPTSPSHRGPAAPDVYGDGFGTPTPLLSCTRTQTSQGRRDPFKRLAGLNRHVVIVSALASLDANRVRVRAGVAFFSSRSYIPSLVPPLTITLSPTFHHPRPTIHLPPPLLTCISEGVKHIHAPDLERLGPRPRRPGGGPGEGRSGGDLGGCPRSSRQTRHRWGTHTSALSFFSYFSGRSGFCAGAVVVACGVWCSCRPVGNQ